MRNLIRSHCYTILILISQNVFSQERNSERIESHSNSNVGTKWNTFKVKKSIDSTALQNWQNLDNVGISNNGKYVFYIIKDKPKKGLQTVVFKSINASWCKEFQVSTPNPSVFFTGDSRFGLLRKKSDSIQILELGTNDIKFIQNGKSFEVSDSENGHWLVLAEEKQSEINVLNLISGEKKAYDNIKQYHFVHKRNQIILITEVEGRQRIVLVNLSDFKEKMLWEGGNIDNLLFDQVNGQFAILAKASSSDRKHEIWNFSYKQSPEYFNITHYDTDTAKIVDLDGYTPDGKHLFVRVAVSGSVERMFLPGSPTIWSYADKKLPTQIENEKGNQETLMASIDLSSKSMILLGSKGERITSTGNSSVLMCNSFSDYGRTAEVRWNGDRSGEFSMIDLINGSRLDGKEFGYLSPSGRFYIYLDTAANDFICFDKQTNSTKNITEQIDTKWSNSLIGEEGIPRGVAKWFSDEKSVLIYDSTDIWKFDLSGQLKPINMTNFYGTKNNIVFSFLNEKDVISEKESNIILLAINRLTKDNGFFNLSLSRSQDPEKLTFGPFIYCIRHANFVPPGASFDPIKSKYAEVHLVRRMSATEAPNYFVTRDFKSFHRISDFSPHTEYNWYKTELHSWSSLDGKPVQGILYKPENFDSNKKYPVLIHYYEGKSEGLNAFLKPAFSNGAINIPHFVSNGYLVFTPDIINFVRGDPMQTTFNTVVSATRYLAKLPYVDEKKIGIQGWSFGGWETNFLVTQTNLFAAAASTAGRTNLISGFGDIVRGGEVNQGFTQYGQLRMANTPWDTPNNYIKSSPVFHANNVVTPLLMMYNPGDKSVLLSQGIEFFTALRRLKRKAWLLSYSDSGHGVYGKSAEDFSSRLMQFFDHFLKDKPAPDWLTFREEDTQTQKK